MKFQISECRSQYSKHRNQTSIFFVLSYERFASRMNDYFNLFYFVIYNRTHLMFYHAILKIKYLLNFEFDVYMSGLLNIPMKLITS